MGAPLFRIHPGNDPGKGHPRPWRRRMRGAVIMDPLRVPNVETETALATRTVPIAPKMSVATSAATSSAPFICSIGIEVHA
mgnify:CR=1 FL=1